MVDQRKMDMPGDFAALVKEDLLMDIEKQEERIGAMNLGVAPKTTGQAPSTGAEQDNQMKEMVALLQRLKKAHTDQTQEYIAKLSELKADLLVMERTKNSGDSQLCELANELRETSNALGKERQERDRIEAEFNVMHKEVGNLGSTLKTVTHGYKTLEQNHDVAMKAHKEDVAHLERARNENNDLSQKLHASKKRIARLESYLDYIEHENVQLKNEVRSLLTHRDGCW